MSIEKRTLLLHSSGVLCPQTYPVEKMNPAPKTLHTHYRELLRILKFGQFLYREH